MTRYYCTACGYRFEPKTNRKPKVCPYCGKRGTLVREGTAQELIDEVSEEDKESEDNKEE